MPIDVHEMTKALKFLNNNHPIVITEGAIDFLSEECRETDLYSLIYGHTMAGKTFHPGYQGFPSLANDIAEAIASCDYEDSKLGKKACINMELGDLLDVLHKKTTISPRLNTEENKKCILDGMDKFLKDFEDSIFEYKSSYLGLSP